METVAEQPAAQERRTIDPRARFYGTGRRKSSVARVFLRAGSGNLQINGRPLEEYFLTETQRTTIRFPLQSIEMHEQFDAKITVRGGGNNGQAGAARLGIARALLNFDIELRPRLKKLGLLTRDSRIKERKKYGQKGARKRFQFSKR